MPKGTNAELEGKRFGTWTVISRHGRDAALKVRWLCRCDCGNESVVQGGNLLAERSTRCRSCGRRKAAETRRLKGQQCPEEYPST